MKEDPQYPWKLVILMGVTNLFLYFVLFSFPSYMPQLIHFYGVDWVEVGHYYGMFGAVYFSAVGIGNLVPALLMTIWSNKNCLILMEFLLGISMICFGFNQSLAYVYVNVVFIGMFLSVIAASKVIIFNFSTPKTEQSILLWSWGGPYIFAQMLGPTLAGFLSFPSFINHFEFFEQYPILLINLLYGSGLLFLTIAAYTILPEDQNMQRYIRCPGDKVDLPEEMHSLTIKDKNMDHTHKNNTSTKAEKSRISREFLADMLRQIWKEIFLRKSTLLSMVLFAGYILLNDVYVHVLPLWLQTPKSLYGRGYVTDDVGYFFLTSGVGFIILNYTVINQLNQQLRPRISCAV